MRRPLLSLACLVIAMAFSVPSAAAQAPTRDSVTGTAEILAVPPSFVVDFTFEASSGPAGEDPAGNVAIDVFGDVNPVTCLEVEGNRAIVGVELIAVEPPGTGALIYVTDGGDVGFPPPDSIGVVITESIPEVCSEQPHTETVINDGNITVVDAQPPSPTSKDQCEKGGWRDFGFKNQGQCSKFVNQEP